MSTAHDFTVFRRVAGDKIAELMERAEKAERELAATQRLLHDSLKREDRFYRELAAKDAEIARLREAAKAVVERWETPLWKDVEPTAHVIYALIDELAAHHFRGVTKLISK